MSAPRDRPVNEGERGSTVRARDRWDDAPLPERRPGSSRPWIALPGVRSSSLLTPFERPGSGDDADTARVKPRREFLNRRRLISTCLEAT